VPDVEIAPASSGETQAFFAAAWRPYDDRAGVSWDGTDHHLAARIGGVLVGAASFGVAGGVGELRQILVRAEQAGTGVGSRLLTAVEAHCRTLGCHKLRLETAEYQARGFYEKHGFTVAHILDDDRFHRTWYVMAKRLG
jgi:GNAT superfamily N-acetyltransferase